MIDIKRFEERKQTYSKAVIRLQEACQQPFSSFIRDSVIQRFEFCWELAWKTLKLRLEYLGVEALNPRETFTEALNKGLIHDGNAWSDLQRQRNMTSHTYNEKLADEVYQFVCGVGLKLFQELMLTVSTWQMKN